MSKALEVSLTNQQGTVSIKMDIDTPFSDNALPLPALQATLAMLSNNWKGRGESVIDAKVGLTWKD